VTTTIVAVGQYLLFVLAAVAVLVWLRLGRADRWRLAAETVVGLAVLGAAIWVAGALHVDPRPFVQDPATPALFPHPADNGFPSDHAAAGGLLAALVVRYRRVTGALVGVGAVVVGAARVAAHVHHVQDVVAGLALGLLAGAGGALLVAAGTSLAQRRVAASMTKRYRTSEASTRS
jgi:undecaprenyl-diphosphatase